VGIFFVALFLTATVLIIYYKQITEGYDDRERFRIMEKVGMSAAEVKKTITRQVIMVFFLPLGVAVIHILAAFRAMCSLLGIFSMHNVGLYAVFTLGAGVWGGLSGGVLCDGKDVLSDCQGVVEEIKGRVEGDNFGSAFI